MRRSALQLDEDALARLDGMSAVPPGFPHGFLREPAITRNVHGDRWAAVEDGRSRYRRTVHGVFRPVRRPGRWTAQGRGIPARPSSRLSNSPRRSASSSCSGPSRPDSTAVS